MAEGADASPVFYRNTRSGEYLKSDFCPTRAYTRILMSSPKLPPVALRDPRLDLNNVSVGGAH
jgi:hypothetical protein